MYLSFNSAFSDIHMFMKMYLEEGLIKNMMHETAHKPCRYHDEVVTSVSCDVGCHCWLES